ncbi:histidine kinase [Nonomuraea sp. NPDC049758]|uniref:sensor histidine kinase n=1 Tax=Nonomuraea sp. NPDC049758 TaxID=3154360 RepID=UPI0034420870
MTGEAAVREVEFGRGRTAARAGSCGWLLLVVWPLWSFFSSRPGVLAVAWVVAAVALFVACWLRIMWRALSALGAATLTWAPVGLVAAALALLPVLRAPWAYVGFVFVVSALSACLSRVAFVVSAAVTMVVVVVALAAYGRSFEQVWWVPLVILVEAVTVASLKHLGEMVARLDAARAHVARLAVDNERLRFARDLHDTLGHTLTSITIRSQLAARLARTDPERAAREMADVERAARQALDEVRHAVAGYRAPSLSGELRTAAHSLDLAGIRLEVSPAAGPVPAAAETLLAWTVREAATNVVRHSRARHCHIDLAVDDHTATVEIRDDGPGPESAGAAAHGDDAPDPGPEGLGTRAEAAGPAAFRGVADGGVAAGAGAAGGGSRGEGAGLTAGGRFIGRGGATRIGADGAGSRAEGGLSGAEGGRADGVGGGGGGAGGVVVQGFGGVGGNGLTGLAERIAAAGGRLEAGPLPGGGYRLHARVPLEVP